MNSRNFLLIVIIGAAMLFVLFGLLSLDTCGDKAYAECPEKLALSNKFCQLIYSVHHWIFVYLMMNATIARNSSLATILVPYRETAGKKVQYSISLFNEYYALASGGSRKVPDMITEMVANASADSTAGKPLDLTANADQLGRMINRDLGITNGQEIITAYLQMWEQVQANFLSGSISKAYDMFDTLEENAAGFVSVLAVKAAQRDQQI